MAKCYAEALGDCDGIIEDEHFIPKSIQGMLGKVTVKGMAWQKGSTKSMNPGSYAHSKIICAKHHDDLDWLDDTAVRLFRNFMLVANPNHVRTGSPGSISDITPNLNGRSIERWFLKTICGAIAANAVEGYESVPEEWLNALFERSAWPESSAFYIGLGVHKVQASDNMFGIDFHWSQQGELNGIGINAFAFNTLFSLTRLNDSSGLLKQPRLLRFTIKRPDSSEVLVGLKSDNRIHMTFDWAAK